MAAIEPGKDRERYGESRRGKSPGQDGPEGHTGDWGRLNIRNMEISAEAILFLSQRANCLSEASFCPL